MTTIYLIRHSIKDKNFGEMDNTDSMQLQDEKEFLSPEGEKKAFDLANSSELQDIDEIWASNYVRAMQTAKYIAYNNNIKINISNAFDERHYGTFESDIDFEEFWINQFKNKELKNEDGESQLDVQNRIGKKIKDIISKNKNKKIAVVCHNACILFYLLKYCKLEDAKKIKKLTISYRGKILINEGIMASPSIMKLEFDDNELIDISYIV